MSTYVGIDLGTTATKAVIIDAEGTVVRRARAPHPECRDADAGREDPGGWRASITAALAALGSALSEVNGVGIDVHCPVAVPLGPRGEAVGKGVTWDNKALRYYFNKYSGERSAEAVAATGNHPSQSTYVAVAHPYLRDHDPGAFSQMTTFGLAGTWLGALFTGETALDPTQASYTGIFDTLHPENGWIGESAGALGIPLGQLPPVRGPLEVLGQVTSEAAENFGVPQGIPVTVGSADTPAASYCLGTTPGSKPFFIIGTTHVVNSCLSAPDLRARALQRCGNRPGEWLINGVTNGGDSLAAGAAISGYGSDGAAVGRMIEEAFSIGCDRAVVSPYFIPHVMRERGPLWLESACGELVEITRGTGRLEAARGIVDGVLLVDRMVLNSCVAPDSGSIYLTGNFGDNECFPQMLADVLGAELDLVDESDLPAIGAAGMCAELIEGASLAPIASRHLSPRPEWVEVNNARWDVFRTLWQRHTGMDLIPELH
jgi:xylulokinase